MSLPPKPPREVERLAALHRYKILDTPVEADYDDITRLIAYICEAPIAVINLIDDDRQFFKSEIGLGVRETPLDISICAHAILESRLFIVPDTERDERFANNPLVTGDPRLRFYAGALLETADGHALGTLCVLDHKPRDLTAEQKDALQILARQVMSMMDLRMRYARERKIAETLQRAMLLSPREDQFPGLSVTPIYEAAQKEAEVGGDFFDVFALPSGCIALLVGDVAGKGLTAAARTAEVKYALRVYLRESPSPAEAISRLNSFLCDNQRLDNRFQDAFVALGVVVLNSQTGQAEVCVAGIEAPTITHPNGVVHAMAADGMPVGITEEAIYSNQRVTLEPGDLLLLLTDGITEARQKRGEFFGYDGVERLLQRTAGTDSLSTIGEALVEEARAFAGGVLRDDVCLLLARRE